MDPLHSFASSPAVTNYGQLKCMKEIHKLETNEDYNNVFWIGQGLR